MFRYFVNYRGIKTPVAVDDKRKLKSECAKKFRCDENRIAIGVYLDEFEDYADVFDIADLPDKGKIRLCEVASASICSASTEPVTDELLAGCQVLIGDVQ